MVSIKKLQNKWRKSYYQIRYTKYVKEDQMVLKGGMVGFVIDKNK